jgi:ribosome biogenesis GTPase
MTMHTTLLEDIAPAGVEWTSPLAVWGWDQGRESAFAEHAAAGFVPGRVSAAGTVTLAQLPTGPAEVLIQRRFRRSAAGPAELPAVGDWLALEPIPDPDGRTRLAALRAVLARTSAFTRGETVGDHVRGQTLAANIDHAFLVSALTRDLNPRRIERYLLLSWASGARPVIVLNKADLADDLDSAFARVAAIAGGAPVHPVSALTGAGLDALDAYLRPGAAICLLGSSGVGKSTLANALLGTERQATAAVRDDDSRGRHTTTARELIPLPGGALVIDTPGLRSIGLWDDGDGLEEAFDDIARLARTCRFSDCRHDREPGCAVRAAIDAGDLAETRLDSQRKLEREVRSLQLRGDIAASRAESRRLGRMHREAGTRTRQRYDPEAWS